METRLETPARWDGETLEKIVGGRLTSEVQSGELLILSYLDTFDWRLHRAGARLLHERREQHAALRYVTGDGAPYTLPVDRDIRFADDLPDGYLRSALGPVLEARALLPLGELEVDRTLARVSDGDGNTTARLWLETSRPADGSKAVAERATIRVEGVPGHADVYTEVVRALRKAGGVAVAIDDLEQAAAAVGRKPGDYSSKPRLTLLARERSDDATRTIFGALLDAMRANVDGVIGDIDVEFLHDLRVATRRTRSAMTQLKGVLPKEAIAHFNEEFKWLGSVTGPCRDLDVYQLEMAVYRSMLPGHEADLRPLEKLIAADRRRAHSTVKRALRSRRFRDLLDDWEAFLAEDSPKTAKLENAGRRVGAFASERILRAYKRALRRGRKIGSDPPPEQLHRMRIDAKKLRYLLEFFHSLYPAAEIDRLVKELKRLQDILGGYNDMVVQQARLLEIADTMIAGKRARAATLLAMGRLAAALDDRQRKYGQAFGDRFSEFASKESRRRYRELFGGS